MLTLADNDLYGQHFGRDSLTLRKRQRLTREQPAAFMPVLANGRKRRDEQRCGSRIVETDHADLRGHLDSAQSQNARRTHGNIVAGDKHGIESDARLRKLDLPGPRAFILSAIDRASPREDESRT